MAFCLVPAEADVSPLLSLTIDRSFSTSLAIHGGVVLAVVLLITGFSVWRIFFRDRSWQSFEVDQAEFGLGDQKIRLTPNIVDKQIAYKIWVELSTRKIGLPIDLEHDVVSEIYDSWFSFFSITRDLIKEVPVQRFSRPDTEKIIRLSIEVLNVGIRPHLTQWQAKFRRWYDRQLTSTDWIEKHPQEIQQEFPQFPELKEDLLAVNQRLINYRHKMYQLISRS